MFRLRQIPKCQNKKLRLYGNMPIETENSNPWYHSISQRPFRFYTAFTHSFSVTGSPALSYTQLPASKKELQGELGISNCCLAPSGSSLKAFHPYYSLSMLLSLSLILSQSYFIVKKLFSSFYIFLILIKNVIEHCGMAHKLTAILISSILTLLASDNLDNTV